MTATAVSPNNVGELVLEELPDLHVGVCRVVYDIDGYIRVYGENDHRVGEVDLDDPYNRKPGWDIAMGDMIDLVKVARQTNQLIKTEHDQL